MKTDITCNKYITFHKLVEAIVQPVEVTMPSSMDHTSTSKKSSNIQKKQQKMAEEVAPEERVRAVEVVEGSSVICGFCSNPKLPPPMEGGGKVSGSHLYL